MENETKKKGLFERLGGVKRVNKSSCCNIQLEEIPEEKDVVDQKGPTQVKKGCCDK